jgi:glycosyltransferase involved in cell wall biosynthesis
VNRPRVAMVSLSPLATGGIETHLLQIFHGLGREFEFHVIGTVAEPFLSIAQGIGVKCIVVPPSGKLDPSALLRLRREFRTQRIDLVHTHDTRGGLLGRLAARSAGLPAVHTVHTPSFFLPTNPAAILPYRLAERFLNGLSAEVIFVSKTIQKMYLDGGLVSAEKARHVANGLEPEWFSPARHILHSETEIRFLFVGRLAREKGIGNLAAAFGTVARKIPWARLQIAGEGPKRADLLQAAEAGGWRKNLDWFGLLLRNKAREAMHAADVFVLPSDFESFSYTLLEAMASGLPCIAADVGGNRDLVDPGVTGLLVPRGDPHRLAEAMIRLADNPEMRISMGGEGALRAREYTLERMMDGTLSVYREALARIRSAEKQKG